MAAPASDSAPLEELAAAAGGRGARCSLPPPPPLRRLELTAKRRFLCARGLRLRIRWRSPAGERLAGWLSARRLWPRRAALAPAAVVAAPLLLWLLCEALVYALNPACRGAPAAGSCPSTLEACQQP